MEIKLIDISAGYSGKNILNHLSLTLQTGKMTGIIGPNGSGKSTLLKCLYRVLTPVTGNIFFDEMNLEKLTYTDSAKKVAVLTQHHFEGFDFSVGDIVLMGRTPYKGITEGDTEEDFRIAADAMRLTGITDLSEKYFSQLSGGEQQRVMLARALAQQTPCLLLDEPTNHLDIAYQLQLMELVCVKKETTIAAIHDLNIAAMYCDQIIALSEGNIVAQGTPEEVLTSELIRNLYQVNASIVTRNDGRPAILYERGVQHE